MVATCFASHPRSGALAASRGSPAAVGDGGRTVVPAAAGVGGGGGCGGGPAAGVEAAGVGGGGGCGGGSAEVTGENPSWPRSVEKTKERNVFFHSAVAFSVITCCSANELLRGSAKEVLQKLYMEFSPLHGSGSENSDVRCCSGPEHQEAGARRVAEHALIFHSGIAIQHVTQKY